jgi:hypothetical protein
MASGDVVFQLNNAPVVSDDSERGSSLVVQTTGFQQGTFLVPSSGISLSEPIRVGVNRTAPTSGAQETLFDSTKLYKITIEEA